MKFDACCGTSAVGIDAVGLTQGYPYVTRSVRATISAAHQCYAQGLMWFWRTKGRPSQSTYERTWYGNLGIGQG
jgi:hypothetical protein